MSTVPEHLAILRKLLTAYKAGDKSALRAFYDLAGLMCEAHLDELEKAVVPAAGDPKCGCVTANEAGHVDSSCCPIEEHHFKPVPAAGDAGRYLDYPCDGPFRDKATGKAQLVILCPTEAEVFAWAAMRMKRRG